MPQRDNPSAFLRNRSWTISTTPFKYCAVRNVLNEHAYESVARSANQILNHATVAPDRSGYDARIVALNETHAESLWPLLSKSWLQTLAAAFDLETTIEVDAALHDHPAGSRRGWIHNDFNPGVFDGSDQGREIIFSDPKRYRISQGQTPKDREVVRMRKIALIFYLGNPRWQPGDGGETGIFSNSKQDASPAHIIPPLDNSMIAFECSPHSFHAFLGCRRPRRSLVLWLHMPLELSHERWPRHAPVFW